MLPREPDEMEHHLLAVGSDLPGYFPIDHRCPAPCGHSAFQRIAMFDRTGAPLELMPDLSKLRPLPIFRADLADPSGRMAGLAASGGSAAGCEEAAALRQS